MDEMNKLDDINKKKKKQKNDGSGEPGERQGEENPDDSGAASKTLNSDGNATVEENKSPDNNGDA